MQPSPVFRQNQSARGSNSKAAMKSNKEKPKITKREQTNKRTNEGTNERTYNQTTKRTNNQSTKQASKQSKNNTVGAIAFELATFAPSFPSQVPSSQRLRQGRPLHPLIPAHLGGAQPTDTVCLFVFLCFFGAKDREVFANEDQHMFYNFQQAFASVSWCHNISYLSRSLQ